MEQTTSSNTESSFDLALYEGVSGEEYFEEHPESRLVRTEVIHFDKLYQARSGVQYKQVNAYATAMKNGHKFPPVRLAWIDDKKSLTVIDGWHRVSAVMQLGAETIPAIVERMSYREAMGKAAVANLSHGLPLKKTELRRVFKLFMKSGSHRKKNKQLMSYREISTALYGCVGHTTIANWMKRDFPKIALAMGGIEHGNSQAELPRVDIQGHYYGMAYSSLEHTRVNFKEITSPTARYEVYKLACEVVAEMGQYPMTEPDF
ncbi:MAG: ParB N-terminal domain-containing protein [Methylotenera sp.]|nr:ParB N-terminal domain-containing protein [Methylotenera sp.]MDP1959668.1 ParB N-terminal domain-containing protein [Methylotenera sp.]MDP3302986.1 ParB N-terminal domain-containing protein [Methylotenera sp.]MDP3943264.1 ParB N-terminal domain-containing protein [Methylotenera sp.]